MTEYTLPRLPAQSDARQFSTLSAPLLFCHCLKEQQPTTSQPTTQQTLTGQRLEALTFVTLPLLSLTYLPIRGPRKAAPTSAAIPPTM